MCFLNFSFKGTPGGGNYPVYPTSKWLRIPAAAKAGPEKPHPEGSWDLSGRRGLCDQHPAPATAQPWLLQHVGVFYPPPCFSKLKTDSRECIVLRSQGSTKLNTFYHSGFPLTMQSQKIIQLPFTTYFILSSHTGN